MPSQANVDKTVCCLCCGSGPFKLLIQTDKSGYVPGETMWISGSCDNNSARNISCLSVELHQVRLLGHPFKNIESCFWLREGLTLVLRREGGCCNPPVIFPDIFWGKPKVAKWLYVIYTNTITLFFFTKMNQNLGVLYG